MNRRILTIFVVLFLGLSAATTGAYVMRGGAVGGDDAAPFTFEEVSAEVGFNYTSGGEGISTTNAGVYVADYNHDGYPDILATGKAGPTLFKNTGGEFERTNALPAFDMTITSALFFDYNGDGSEDLLLIPKADADDGAERPVVLRNDGDRFVVTQRLNITFDDYPLGATTADYNGDGHLDLFIFQAGEWSERTPVGYHNASSVGNVTDDNGAPNFLFKGTGSGFVNVTSEAGISGERWSLMASFIDLTGDGRPDIHVGNDFNEDILYVNQGNGTFDLQRMGDVTDRNQMSSEVADVNDDGRPDLFLTNIFVAAAEADLSKDTEQSYENQDQSKHGGRAKGNNLMINQGGGEFVDRAAKYGVKRTPNLWGWAAVMADLDNDGDPDLVHANNERNGITSGGQQMLTAVPTPPAVWEFEGGKFHTVNPVKLGFEKQDGRGMAKLDYDLDGDLDLLIADNDGRYRLYENQQRGSNGGLFSGGEQGNAIQILVRGEETYLAHGAKVTVTVDNRTEYRFVNAKTDYLSQDSRVIHLGLGTHETVDRIEITWPDGTTRTFTDVRADRRLTAYPNGTVTSIQLQADE